MLILKLTRGIKGMLYVQRVEIYDVNGYTVCAKDVESLEVYLSDLPKGYIKNKDYDKESYVILTELEYLNFSCKELQHMKINRLFTTEESALIGREYMVNQLMSLIS